MTAGTSWWKPSSPKRASWVVPVAIIAAVAAAAAMPASAQSAPGAGSPGGPSADDVVSFDSAAPIGPSSLSPMNREKLRSAKRARFVDLPTTEVAGALDSSDVGIELFPDVVAQLGGEGPRVAGANGSTTWSGLADDGDYATLTFLGGQTIGTVAVDGVVYDISPVAGGTHLITEEGRDFPAEADPLVPPARRGDDGQGVTAPAASAPESAPVVDVLTWYDTAARTYSGSDVLARADLAATINETNAAYGRSGVNQSLRSVGIEHVSYTGSGFAEDELVALTGRSDGVLDSVHARRDELRADLVALITPIEDACGIAHLGGREEGGKGFSVTRPDCARGALTYAHELGHNMGAGHGPWEGDPSDEGLFPYSRGYRDEVHDFRTIMAYDDLDCPGGSCQSVAYFSGPTSRWSGFPVGSATFDNTRTINERAAITANYRGPVLNDHFGNAVALSGDLPTATGTNVGATRQLLEPLHHGKPGDTSIWYRWTAPRTQRVEVNTFGSSFDTLLGVYHGRRVSTLTRDASNDDSAGGMQSRARFNAVAGRVYRIAVAGFQNATGSVRLQIKPL